MKEITRPVDLSTIKTLLEREKPRLQKEYCIKEIGIFGSYARGDQRASSDIDILVSFAGRISGFKYIGLKQELSDKLGKEVHISSKEFLKPRLGEIIKREVVYI